MNKRLVMILYGASDEHIYYMIIILINQLLRHEMFHEIHWIFGGNSWKRSKQENNNHIKTGNQPGIFIDQ